MKSEAIKKEKARGTTRFVVFCEPGKDDKGIYFHPDGKFVCEGYEVEEAGALLLKHVESLLENREETVEAVEDSSQERRVAHLQKECKHLRTRLDEEFSAQQSQDKEIKKLKAELFAERKNRETERDLANIQIESLMNKHDTFVAQIHHIKNLLTQVGKGFSNEATRFLAVCEALNGLFAKPEEKENGDEDCETGNRTPN